MHQSDPKDLAAKMTTDALTLRALEARVERESLELAVKFHFLIGQALDQCADKDEKTGEITLNLAELDAGKELLLICQSYNALAVADAQRRTSLRKPENPFARIATQPTPPTGGNISDGP